MLTFEESTHTYYWDGVEVPSVSSFLEKAEFKKPSAWYTPGAAERGTEIHRLTELFDLGLLDLSSDVVAQSSDVVQGHLQAWAKFRRETGFRPHQVEIQLCNVTLWLAGTVDRIGDFHGRRAKVDLKTGSKAPWHKYQLAAYNLLDDSRDTRVNVYTKADGTYKLQTYADPSDHLQVLRALSRIRGVA